ncbi:hypothetical protein DdX_20059 [Ditylenchus destructor]|uniref:F-box domain-containing protein n=1 Tax=Ditylenchus destructor TaxID=166010 RepID=A0AAD4MI73_9BILA|nr:hypothetical protein DdX_20059 [Ditylenchus destructor]
MANMDNGTMVEAFKYLNYCQLAKNSLVSKRFRNVIGTHRHKLALLYVDNIDMGSIYEVDPGVIKLFNKEISSEEYNEWVVRNNYSKQISPICQAAGDRRAYELTAYGDYKDPKQASTITRVFHARVEQLNNETWPLFQHFVRLITDPFIRIRYLGLIPQADVLKLLSATIDRSNRGHLQCETLNFNFEGDVQESFSYHDKQLLDFFATGSDCTSEIFVTSDHISKAVIVDFVQKFMDLKSRDDSQLVESIRGRVSIPTANELKTNYEKFFIKAEEYANGWITARIFEFANADIAKKLQLTISYSYRINHIILKIINL